jgi:hypothetical protein
MCFRRYLLQLAIAVPLLVMASYAGDLQTVVPKEIDGPVNNPYMGWGLWAGPRYFDGKPFTLEYNTTGFGDDAPLFSWVLVDWMWSDLEPEEGKFYWKDLDAILDYWAARGKQIYLRVWITEDPGWDGAPGNEVFPSWFLKSGARFREYLAQGKFKKVEPDYADPSYEAKYLPKARNFLTALAARYDKPESPIVMWGVMGYGQWGEWHVLWSKYPWPNREVKHKTLAKVVNMYGEIFRGKLPCISYCFDTDYSEVRDLDDYLYRQALDVALAKGWALARHGFFDGLRLYDRKVMETYWKKVPMLAESNWAYTDVKNHKNHGTVEEYMEVYRDWHSNFAHYYMDADSYKRAMREDRAHFEEGLRAGGLGFRFALKSASWSPEVPAGHLFVVRQTWVNRNVGRLYLRHPVKICLTDAQGNEKASQVDRSFDQSNWIAGETYPVVGIFRIPKDLAPGQYDVRIAMVDAGTGAPRIKLAIEGEDAAGRYRLGAVKVLPAQ